MRIIRRIRIRNFRSLRSLELADLDGYVPIIGLNGSGKSNVLRALNLLLNDEVEPGLPFDLKRDHFDPGRPLGGRREVVVGIELDLQGYTPRPEVAELFRDLGVEDQVAVERAWRYVDPSARATTVETRSGVALDALEDLSESQTAAVTVLLRSVLFRYLPNHLQPSQVIAAELQTLRSALLRRFRTRKAYREGGIPGALKDLQVVAADITSSLSSMLTTGVANELRDLKLDIPSEFADLAFELGITVERTSGVTQPPSLQGSGTQSFLLVHILTLLDRAEFEVSFGWTKAVVWAIEEPESFLHAGLRSRLASDLRALSEEARRQVLVTTHQDEFVRMGDHAWVVTLSGPSSAVERLTGPEALLEASRQRISTLPHPLMSFPDQPLVLLEGPTDVKYLSAAMSQSDMRPRWTASTIPALDPGVGGGTAAIAYLKMSRTVLNSRAATAPVFVVLDWEVTDGTLNQVKAILAGHPHSRALRMPVALANPDLGSTFTGIERFLPTDFLRTCAPNAVTRRSVSTELPLRCIKAEMDPIKSQLADECVRTGAVEPFLVDVFSWLNSEVEGAITQVPIQQFLPITFH